MPAGEPTSSPLAHTLSAEASRACGQQAAKANSLPRCLLRARSPQLWLVLAAVGWQLWAWRAERLSVSYLYDASVHLEMTRFATVSIETGRVPFSSWFPYVGLGSPQYSQYQSLASVLTGLVGTLAGAANAFRWSLYLLVACWPVAIYASARLLGLARSAAAASAVLAVFVVSFTGTGFEQNAYAYIGGAELWTQLFGGWALAFAWAASWRAFCDGRYLWLAAGLSGLTIAFHFECGYLALLGIMVMALAAEGRLLGRLVRGAVLLAGSLAAAAWVIVPLMAYSKWSAINEALQGTDYVRGYGAAQELDWLFTGELFDARRAVPVISVLVALGVIFAVARWRRRALERSLLLLFVASLALSFGPTTFGALSALVPAHKDLYFRRFTMGTQLAGLYLAGTAVPEVWSAAKKVLVPLQRLARQASEPLLRLCLGGLAVAGAGAWLSPAVAQLYRFDRADAAAIQAQREADARARSELSPLISYVRSHGQGRVYAGQSDNWGNDFLVGSVPVYKYLLQHGVDEMAYVVPSMSLMLVPEAEFDEARVADYGLFGVRYLLLPTGAGPPVTARFVMARGPYALWELPSTGYVEPVQIAGLLVADRADVGSVSLGLLYSAVPGQDKLVDWPGDRASTLTFSKSSATGAPGAVLAEDARLGQGSLAARVKMARAGSLLLSVSYQPGWHVWVDGKRAKTEMLAPALVGVALGRGPHQVLFRYVGFRWYAELWAASGLVLTALWWAGRHPLRQARAVGRPSNNPPAPASPSSIGSNPRWR